MQAEVRMARIVEAIGLYRTGKVTCEAAAEWLAMSERHFRSRREPAAQGPTFPHPLAFQPGNGLPEG
jgi:hypothetical protein